MYQTVIRTMSDANIGYANQGVTKGVYTHKISARA